MSTICFSLWTRLSVSVHFRLPSQIALILALHTLYEEGQDSTLEMSQFWKSSWSHLDFCPLLIFPLCVHPSIAQFWKSQSKIGFLDPQSVPPLTLSLLIKTLPLVWFPDWLITLLSSNLTIEMKGILTGIFYRKNYFFGGKKKPTQKIRKELSNLDFFLSFCQNDTLSQRQWADSYSGLELCSSRPFIPDHFSVNIKIWGISFSIAVTNVLSTWTHPQLQTPYSTSCVYMLFGCAYHMEFHTGPMPLFIFRVP